MKTLTLTQPWATLVAIRAKRNETRSWSTRYRGPMAIHAGKGMGPVGGKSGLQRICDRAEFSNALWHAGVRKADPPDDGWDLVLPLGAIVATCELVDCVPTEHVKAVKIIRRGDHEWCWTEQEAAFGDYSAGRFAWLLANITPLATPIPARGAIGLWEWTP